jgi:pyruvate,water dikinase
MSGYLWDIFLPAFDEGARRAMARYGCAIDRLDCARICGRQYIRIHYASDAQELQERRDAAANALSSKLWRQDRAAWPGLRDSLHARLLEIARRNPNTMAAGELDDYVGALENIFVEGATLHFVQQPASMYAVGDWIRRTRQWTGASTSEIVGVLQSSSEASDNLRIIDELIQLIRTEPQALGLIRENSYEPQTRLQSLRSISQEVSQKIADYLDEYADRIVTGFDITDATLAELPQFTLAVIAARMDNGPDESQTEERRTRRLELETQLRERVPANERIAFDEGLMEARAAYALHDEDVRITYLWPLGLLRRALLEVARRLVDRGALRSIDDVFHLTSAEVHALLAGAPAPTLEEISSRVRRWRAWFDVKAPASFGVQSKRPSDELLGPACARMTDAIQFYLREMESGPARTAPTIWPVRVEGLTASPGCYQGRARIVRGPADFGKLDQGDVLVAYTTSPAYNVILPIIGAVVTDRGGALCHAAILAREFGVPAVVGANYATTRIPDGADVVVDADHGFVAVRE